VYDISNPGDEDQRNVLVGRTLAVQPANPKSHGDELRMRIWCFKTEHSWLNYGYPGLQYWGFGVEATNASCKKR